jgi:hypothetical protein
MNEGVTWAPLMSVIPLVRKKDLGLYLCVILRLWGSMYS